LRSPGARSGVNSNGGNLGDEATKDRKGSLFTPKKRRLWKGKRGFYYIQGEHLPKKDCTFRYQEKESV